MNHDVVRELLVHSGARNRAAAELAHRVLDCVIATLALVAFAPLMALAAGLIWLERQGPVLFVHLRVGRDGRTFHVFKFRTMCTDGDRVLREHLSTSAAAAAEWEETHKLRNDPRVGRLGLFLRRSSIDELPQVLNVLRGEMSIVGPRPIVHAEIGRYGTLFEAYCSVRPGITGIWQVSGRNDISYQRRVEMDALYARKKTVLLDLSIIAATVPAVLRRRGSY